MESLVRPEKEEKNRTRLVVGGNKINYPGDVGTPTADMLLAKILFNSVISTKGARFMTADVKNFYMMTPLLMLMFILNLTTIFIYLNLRQDCVIYKAYILNPCPPRPPAAEAVGD